MHTATAHGPAEQRQPLRWRENSGFTSPFFLYKKRFFKLSSSPQHRPHQMTCCNCGMSWPQSQGQAAPGFLQSLLAKELGKQHHNFVCVCVDGCLICSLLYFKSTGISPFLWEFLREKGKK